MAQRQVDPSELMDSAGGAPPGPRPVDPSELAGDGDSSINWPAVIGGGALAAGAYALTRNSGVASKVMNGVNDVRRLSMLSGLAPLKSLLGNVGGTAYESIERGSMAPLRELFSGGTVQDIGRLLKQGPNQALAGPATGISKYNLPARFMGALDEASQNALVRSGVMHDPAEVAARVAKGVPVADATEKSARGAAARAMLQSPVVPPWDTANPVAGYVVPFYRTAANQFGQGMNALDPRFMTKGRVAANAVSAGTGFLEGENVEDPKTLALGTAASGRYGLTHMIGQAAGRTMAGGSKKSVSDVFKNIGPVSDYSVAEAFTQPKQILPPPAAISAIEYLKSMLGIQ